jgi:hypothetical protein
MGNRIFNFVTPMKDIRSIAAYFLAIVIRACGNAAGIADIAFFPLLDINFAKGVHNILNALMYTVLQLPSVTVQRCLNNNKDIIMCLPDFDPPINMLVAGKPPPPTLKTLEKWPLRLKKNKIGRHQKHGNHGGQLAGRLQHHSSQDIWAGPRVGVRVSGCSPDPCSIFKGHIWDESHHCGGPDTWTVCCHGWRACTVLQPL